MQIEFKPEDIEKYVKDAIIKSSIGKAIDEGIRDVLNVNSYSNPIKKQLEIVVKNIASEVIQEKFTDSIKKRLSILIESLVTDEMLQKLTNTAVDKMVRAMQYD